MNKRLLFCLIGSLFCLNDAFCESYTLSGSKNVSSAAATEWGDPYINSTFIQDANRQPYGFRIKQGWACCTNLSYQQVADIRGANRTEDRIVSLKDDAAIIAFVARKIYPHGGQFCLTQISAKSSSGNLEIMHQQPNWPGMPCVVLCEPGWDGAKCDKIVSGIEQDTSCDTTDIAANIERVKQNVYENNDAITFHKWRMGVADDIEFFARTKLAGAYEHVIYLGATDFLQHGIVAQPMLLGSVGNHPYPTHITSGPALSGKSKVLCAQGFTKNDKCEINSRNCGSNVWCTGYSDANFKSGIHAKHMKDSCNMIVCKDRSKALDANFNCVEYDNTRKGLCEDYIDNLYGKLVECGEGYIFNKDTCKCDKASATISKDIMQFGPRGRNTTEVNEQCWTKETKEDFENCVLPGRKSY